MPASRAARFPQRAARRSLACDQVDASPVRHDAEIAVHAKRVNDRGPTCRSKPAVVDWLISRPRRSVAPRPSTATVWPSLHEPDPVPLSTRTRRRRRSERAIPARRAAVRGRVRDVVSRRRGLVRHARPVPQRGEVLRIRERQNDRITLSRNGIRLQFRQVPAHPIDQTTPGCPRRGNAATGHALRRGLEADKAERLRPQGWHDEQACAGSNACTASGSQVAAREPRDTTGRHVGYGPLHVTPAVAVTGNRQPQRSRQSRGRRRPHPTATAGPSGLEPAQVDERVRVRISPACSMRWWHGRRQDADARGRYAVPRVLSPM